MTILLIAKRLTTLQIHTYAMNLILLSAYFFELASLDF